MELVFNTESSVDPITKLIISEIDFIISSYFDIFFLSFYNLINFTFLIQNERILNCSTF